MFGKKKLYKITYQIYATHITTILAKNSEQALKKLYKQTKKRWFLVPDVISIQEVIM